MAPYLNYPGHCLFFRLQGNGEDPERWAHYIERSRADCYVSPKEVAERALRPVVLWRKGSFGSDSEVGSRFAERLLTVVATCRQQGRRLLDFLVATNEAALRGSQSPSLLLAPRGD